MSNLSIRVENLSKRYHIGRAQQRHDTLRDALMAGLQAPLGWLRRNGRHPGRTHNDDTIWALKDVSFEVKPGEILGIIGRNGAGKSTLLKILSHITEPTAGRAEIYGRVGSLLEVGTGFHPELTGRENIYLNGAILGMRKAEIDRKFEEIVAFAEIEKFLDTPVKRYSSGMYVRLAFAVAAHLETEIILVDEVLAVGDAIFQKKCLGKIGDVTTGGRTVLFVSHNMKAVRSLCDTAVWLDHGKIVDAGDVNEVVSNYLQAGMHSLTEQVWDNPATAPGNDKVRLCQVCVKPLHQEPGEPITISTALQLEFEFWNYTPGACLNFSVVLNTVEGTTVFNIVSDASPRPRGLVRGKLQIPPDFLNDGVYSVIVMIIKDRSRALYQHPDALIFEVVDSERANGWYGKWPGLVRPKLDFLTENIEAWQ